jgi:hypothetical protein
MIEYGILADPDSLAGLVAQLNVIAAEGWELAAVPPKRRGSDWLAVIRRDPDATAAREEARAALKTYQAMCEGLQHDRAELETALESLRRKLAEPEKH